MDSERSSYTYSTTFSSMDNEEEVPVPALPGEDELQQLFAALAWKFA